ncbi:hypothetical protein A3Q56_06446 [Intoshia linei]|uniref:RdRp catalytic domain-containing protein n=1 Tax=Intoshia linei TaxID=1819745 RepID=A0A177AV19_9BILA|nr:hypothetical protein A3Q56_06446 [Intoshia linei]
MRIKSEEDIEIYVYRLRKAAERCKYDEVDHILRDHIFIYGTSKTVQNDIIKLNNPSLTVTVKTKNDCVIWNRLHEVSTSRARDGTAFQKTCQTQSGDPSTAIVNTIYNMISCTDLINECTDIQYAIFMGDDSLISCASKI